MSRVLKVVIASLALAFFVNSAYGQSAKRGTREEAVALVAKVKQMWNTQGPGKTIKAVNSLSSGFRDRDLYPFICHTDGYVVAHFVSALRGLMSIENTDQRGRFMIRDMIKVINRSGKGWTNYDWPNPITRRIDAKESYVEALGEGYFVGVGVFKRLQDKDIIVN